MKPEKLNQCYLGTLYSENLSQNYESDSDHNNDGLTHNHAKSTTGKKDSVYQLILEQRKSPSPLQESFLYMAVLEIQVFPLHLVCLSVFSALCSKRIQQNSEHG